MTAVHQPPAASSPTPLEVTLMDTLYRLQQHAAQQKVRAARLKWRGVHAAAAAADAADAADTASSGPPATPHLTHPAPHHTTSLAPPHPTHHHTSSPQVPHAPTYVVGPTSTPCSLPALLSRGPDQGMPPPHHTSLHQHGQPSAGAPLADSSPAAGAAGGEAGAAAGAAAHGRLGRSLHIDAHSTHLTGAGVEGEAGTAAAASPEWAHSHEQHSNEQRSTPQHPQHLDQGAAVDQGAHEVLPNADGRWCGEEGQLLAHTGVMLAWAAALNHGGTAGGGLRGEGRASLLGLVRCVQGGGGGKGMRRG